VDKGFASEAVLYCAEELNAGYVAKLKLTAGVPG